MFINYNLEATIDKVRLDQVIADEVANAVADAAHLADYAKHRRNVKDFYQESDNGDWSLAINRAIQSIKTVDATLKGGIVFIPMGRYAIKGSILLDFDSITLEGEGQQNTELNGSGLAANTSGIIVSGNFCKLKNFEIRSCTGDGISLGTSSALSHLEITNVRTSFNSGNGLLIGNVITSSFKDVFATHNGIDGIHINGYCTSLNFLTCYADHNTGEGFYIKNITYSSFVGCASDNNNRGYSLSTDGSLLQNINFSGCGAESCVLSGFYLRAVNSGVIKGVNFENCFAFQCDSNHSESLFLYALTTSPALIFDITLSGCSDMLGTSLANYSVVANGSGVNLTFAQSTFTKPLVNSNGGVIKGTTLDNGFTLNTRASLDSVVTNVSVTAANTPVCSLSNGYGGAGAETYSGLLVVTARYGTASSANTACYVLSLGKHLAGSGLTQLSSNGVTSGGSASHPSFTFSLDTTNNKLLASPIGSTGQAFNFHICALGDLSVSA